MSPPLSFPPQPYTPPTPDDTCNTCNLTFQAASQAESTAFLLGLAGKWHDALEASVLEENEHIREGLSISVVGIHPARFSVDNIDESLKYTKNLVADTTVRIGRVTSDGYRLVELHPPGGCLLYALKASKDGYLLVRGPLQDIEMPFRGEGIYEKFLAATADKTRLFERFSGRFSEPSGQITAISKESVQPNYVTRSKPTF